jgi:histidine ammonia-lyase
MTMGLEINSRSDLTLEACRRVAWGGETVTLGPEAIAKLTKARDDFLLLLDDPDITIYGVNTGYGHRAKERLTKQGRLAQAVFPTHHRAASWGDDLPQRVVRGIIFARLGNFLDGHSAVSPHVAQAVAAMLAQPALPSVPARGQGGAGEILSLSHLFMDLAASIPLAEKDMLSCPPVHVLMWRWKFWRSPLRPSMPPMAILPLNSKPTGIIRMMPGRYRPCAA